MSYDVKKPWQKFARFTLRAHRWLGLILGAQILLWVMSGVVMSWFHINLVRGETYAKIDELPDLPVQIYAAPGGVLAETDATKTVQLTYFQGRPVYVTTDRDNKHDLFDALSGEKISPLDERDIRKVAEIDYLGDAKIQSARLLTKTPHEYRGALPVWQVRYNDKLETRLYISPGSGEVLSRRNKIWRLYYFFWMLHIMDYEEREDFNNPLVKTFSASTLLFVLSGFLLLIFRVANGKFSHDINRLMGKG